MLLAVSSEKTVWSTRIGASVFKFVEAGTELIEIETGYSKNESVSYAVRKAIDKAVIEMITEGEKQGLWEYVEVQGPKPKEEKSNE